MKIVLGSGTSAIEFNTSVPDADGALWLAEKIEGWESPGMRQTTVEPTSRHGNVVAQNLLGARALTLTGTVKTTGGESAYWKAYNKLLGTTANLGTTIPLVCTEDVDKQVNVLRSDVLRVAIQAGWFTFEIPLMAPDPLKYATTATGVTIGVGETKTLTNNGTFDSNKITAQTAGQATTRLTHLGTTRYVATDTVPAGALFDFPTRTVTASGINMYGQVKSASVWWSLAPGANQIRNDGATSMTLSYYSAWV